jgi:hypothetical protein
VFSQALDQHVNGKKLISQETEDSDFESYLRDATSRLLYQPAFMYGGFYLSFNIF